MKKIILGAALAFVSMSLTSCLHDNEELFDKPAAERMQEAIKADKELLESATNGWQMHYYTGEQYTGGGYTMFMKFKGGKAYVSSDIAPSDMVSSSSYDVISDRGPVLTFNTYNTVMHYLSQPYQDDVDGEQGDYEFVISKTSQDTIYVKGKKWGNSFVMTRVPENVSWKEEIDKIQNTLNSMNFFYLADGASDASQALSIDADAHRAYLGSDESKGVPFYVTDKGIKLHSPLSVDGKSFDDLTFNAEAQTLTSADNSVVFKAYTPDGFLSINEFYGNWNLGFQSYTQQGLVDNVATLSLNPVSALIQQKSMSRLVGFIPLSSSLALRVVMTYSPQGKLSMPMQYVYAVDPTTKNIMSLSNYVPGCAVLKMVGINSDGLINGTDNNMYYNPFTVEYDSDSQSYNFVDASGSADGLTFICCDSSGSPIYELSDGSYTSDRDKVDAEYNAGKRPSIATFTFMFHLSSFVRAN